MQASNFWWKVNNGSSVLFWEDIWFQDCELKLRFGRLYKLSKCKHIEVGIWDCYEHTGEAFWNRKLRGWEVEEIIELECILKTIKLNGKADELIWKPGNASFSTKTRLDWLMSDSKQEVVSWAFLWKIKVLPKVMIFLWKVQRNLLPTRVFLHKRMGQEISSTVCLFCHT